MRPIPVSPAYEAALLDERDNRQARIQAMAEQMSPNAGNIAALADRYPYAQPGVLAGMGMVGLDPDSAQAEQLAALSLEDSFAASPFDLAPNGTPMRAGTVRATEEAAHGTPPPPEPGVGGFGGFMKGISRAVIGGAGYLYEDVVSRGLSAIGTAAFDDRPGFLADVGEYWGEARRAPLAYAYQDWRQRMDEGGDWWDLPVFDQEYAGDGFFIQGEAWDQGEEDKQNLQVDGEFVTPGRSLALVVNRGTGGRLLEPGTESFNFASGVADFASNIFLDPLNYVAGGGLVGKVDNAGNAIRNVDEILPQVQRLTDNLRNAPLRGQGQSGVDTELLEGSLFGGNAAGRQLIEALRSTDNVGALARAFNHRVDPQVLREIADTDDYARIVELTRGFLGSRVREMPSRGAIRALDPTSGSVTGVPIPGAGAVERRLPSFVRNWWDDTSANSRRLAYLRRATASVPGGGRGGIDIDLTDPAKALKGVDDWLTAAAVPLSRRDEFARRFVELGPLDADAASYAAMRPLIRDILAEGADTIIRANRLGADDAGRLVAASDAAADRLDLLDPDLIDDTDGMIDRIAADAGEVAELRRVRNRVSAERTAARFSLPELRDVERFAEELTSFGDRFITEARMYDVDSMGRHIPTPGMRYKTRQPDGSWEYSTIKPGQVLTFIDGQIEVVPGAVSPMYAMSNSFTLPNTERLVRASGMWSRWKSAEVPILGVIPGANRASQSFAGMSETIYDTYMTKIQPRWQQAAILKPALLLRNMMENLFSLSSEGYVDMGSRSLDYFAAVAGHGGDDLVGTNFAAIDEVRAKLGGIADMVGRDGRGAPGTSRSPQWRAVSQDDGATYWDAWARRLMGYAQSPVHGRIAALGPEEFTRLFVAGDAEIVRLVRQADDMLPRNAGFTYSGNPQAVREWAQMHDTALSEMGAVRSGDTRLLGEIADGNFGGAGVLDPTKVDRRTIRAVASHLRNNYAATAPARVPGRVDITLDPTAMAGERSMIGSIFHALVQAPEQKLAYIPVYSQAYWNEVSRLLPYASDEVATQVRALAGKRGRLIVDQAEDASIPTRIKEKFFQQRGQRILDNIDAAGSNGTNAIATLDEFVTLSRSNAAERLSDVLMDVTERGRFFEGIRFVSPFANVYSDVVRRYKKRFDLTNTRGLARSLRTVRRLDKGISSASESDPFDFTMLGGEGEFTKGPGRGFFYLDANGENRFAFPSPLAASFMGYGGGTFGALAGGALGGTGGALVGGAVGATAGVLAGRGLQTGGENTDVGLTANPASLNLVASSPIPGVGPTVQIPATYLLANRPDEDALRELLLPFGEARGVLDSFVPPWIARGMQAVMSDPETDANFGNVVGEVMQALMASGEFSDPNTLSSREGQEALLAEATRRARHLTLIRAFAASSFPASPSFDFTADTAAGEFSFNVLRMELRKLQDEEGYDEGFREFIDLFGSDFLPITQASTQQVRRRAVDRTGAQWERDHPQQAATFRNTIGYFAPSDPAAPLDFRAYTATLERGDRDQLSPRDQLLLYNNTAGRIILANERRRMGELADTPEGRAQLRMIRGNLMREYPGFDQVESIRRRAGNEEILTEVRDAVLDPVLRTTDTGKAVSTWLPAYDAAMQEMADEGYATLTNASVRAAELRLELRSLGDELAMRYPDFADLWASVLANEVTTTDERNTGLGAA